MTDEDVQAAQAGVASGRQAPPSDWGALLSGGSIGGGAGGGRGGVGGNAAGYGMAPAITSANPSFAARMGVANEYGMQGMGSGANAAYQAGAGRLRQDAYNTAQNQADTGYNQSQQLWNTLYGHLQDFHNNMQNSLGSWLAGNSGGAGIQSADLQKLLAPIMAQQATREQLAQNQAKNTFTAQGRDPTASTYLGQIMPALQSRFSTDNAAELSKATIGYLDPLLRNQQANAQLGLNMFNTQNSQYMDLARTLSGMRQ